MLVHLPETFTAKIRRVFGQAGDEWLSRLPGTLARCQERWRLTDLRLASELSYNLICFAESPEHGPVALKIGMPDPEFYTQVKALTLYAGRGICKCYAADKMLGAMLLERIEPGVDLRTVTDPSARFRIAADLIAALPVAIAAPEPFPAYADWVTRAFTRARAEGRAPAALLALVDVAARCFQEIDTPDRPRLLLHGDLHHMNILQDRQSGWKAIDPKGVIGQHCIEVGRFILNEIEMGDAADRLDRLDLMTSILAERLREPKGLLARCAVVDRVLATCWDVEENASPSALNGAIEACKLLWDYALSQ